MLSSVVRQNDAHRGRSMRVARKLGRNSIGGGTGAPACGRREASPLSLALLSSRPTTSISNRHWMQLEFAVTHSKQSLNAMSNRHPFRVCPSVSVNSVRRPSVPSVFQTLQSPAPTPAQSPREILPYSPQFAYICPAEISLPVLEFNVNR